MIRAGAALLVLVFVGTSCTFDPVRLRELRDQGATEDFPREDALVRDARGEASSVDLRADQLQPDTMPSCQDGQLVCGGKCVDPLSDQENCGGCGKVCGSDQHCDQGLCCDSGLVNCDGVCSALLEDEANCGQCGMACDSNQQCDQGLCCDSGLTNCNGSCVDTLSDPENCGQCGLPCVFPRTCDGGDCRLVGCADGTDEQAFSQGMRGCAGTRLFGQRADLCGPGFRVCTAAEWVVRRNGQAPTYNYWTDDALHYYGTDGTCWVSLSSGYACSPESSPMRVCSGEMDPLGNECNWTGCGLDSYANDYFGGCNDNLTAGALCCPQ